MWNDFLFKIIILLATYVYCRADLTVSPLTKLRTGFACHKQTTSLVILCEIGHRIRILDSFYAVSTQPFRDYCKDGYKDGDCKSYTNIQSSCNGKQACSISMYEAFISDCNAKSDYLIVLYECIPETKVHSVCSNVEDYSTWGTLQTTDFPNPYASNENCWCKLTSNQNQRIVLSVIAFQLFPYDPTCLEAGLYLQSERKKSKECTILQQGHYYISSSSNLFLNFYSKRPIVRGGFWIIYEAGDSESKIHLKCGDTDEVRPSDFTRYSQVDKIFTTNYLFELTNVSSTQTASPTPSILTKLLTSQRNKTTSSSTTTRKSLGKDATAFDATENRKKTQPVITETQKYRTFPIVVTTTKESNKVESSKSSKIISTILSSLTKSSTKMLPPSIVIKNDTRPLISLSKPVLTGLEYLFNRTNLNNFKFPSKNETLKLISSSTRKTTTTATTTTSTIASTSVSARSEYTTTITPFTVKLKKFTLKIPSLIKFNKTGGDSELLNVAEVFNATNRTDEDLMSMIGYLENSKKVPDTKINTNSMLEKKLGKTELTIIISCVLFITLLTFVNLIIYALRKVVKRTSREVNQANLTDKGKKSYDILPGVGEIILWAAKDKRGYLIDINGSWAKIDGQRWIRENMAVLHNTYKKASMAYRNRFRKKDDKKFVNKEDDRLINKGPPPTNVGACSLPPVPEAAEYEISDNTSSVSTLREENNQATESEYQIDNSLSAKIPPSTDTKSETMYNIDPSQGSAAYQIQSSEMVTSDGETIDSTYYQEKKEAWHGNVRSFTHIQLAKEKSLSPCDVLPPPPPIMLDGNCETVSSDDNETESAFIIKRPILIRGDADFLKNFPCNYANEMSENGFSDGQEFESINKKGEHVFLKASQHIQNESAIKIIQIEKAQKISESRVEPAISNLKHARVIAQPLQRNTSDIIIPENTSTSMTSNITVKLDPSILKYTNQPVAIVAPSKSNHNSLEKKKLHSNDGAATNLSLRPVHINDLTTDSEYEISALKTENEKKKEYIIGNVQSCVDNGKILLQACSDTSTIIKYDTKLKDSGFLDDRSVCSSTTIGSEFNKRTLLRSHNFMRPKGPKHTHRYEDSGIDKESSSSDIDEIARFNQMELRRQAIRIRKKNTSLNTVPKPKPRIQHSASDRQPLDARNLIYDYLDNKSVTTDEIVSTNQQHMGTPSSQATDVYHLSPMLNSCGLIMCSTLPTPVFHSFIPASLIPISFPNGGRQTATPLFIPPNVVSMQQEIDNEAPTIKKRGNKTVTFATQDEEKTANLKKTCTFQERTRMELEEAAQAWQKRQASCSNDAAEPPMDISFSKSQSLETINNCQDEESNDDVNSDEFQFFMNAIEKLKAANLFHEDDLKKMTDEQIYEALIEHARMQKKAKDPVVIDNTLQSIDKEEEDLPIIMRNLHSVKSLKHYFEIKAKAASVPECTHSPSFNKKPATTTVVKTEVLETGVGGEENMLDVKEVSINTDTVSRCEPPAPPPLPDDLFKTLDTSTARDSLLKHSESYKKRKGSLEVQQSCCSPTPFTEHRDLHEKLIREIHNKSMERSRKETNICLDERGNLIHKPVGRVYTSVKNQKLYRIKDNSSISSVEIKEFPRLEHLRNSRLAADNHFNNSIFEEEISVKPESTKIDVVAEPSFVCIDIKSATNAELVESTVLGSELNEPCEITQSFVTQNSNSDLCSTMKRSVSTSEESSPKKLVSEYGDEGVDRKKDVNAETTTPTAADIAKTKHEDDENDQLSELISISQVPSVFPSIDRREPIYKSSSFKAFDSSTLESVQEIRRTISFKSDVSNADTISLKSTRSMLSEAKAKLEILSAKLSRNNGDTFKRSTKSTVKKSTYGTSDETDNYNTFNDTEEEITKF